LNAPLVRGSDLHQITDKIRVSSKDPVVFDNILIVLLHRLRQTLHVCCEQLQTLG
jgi:hypothetical protein